MRICFDMDGTIADLYGVEGWLESLIAEDVKPYAEAKPLVNLSLLARLLNKAQREGYEIVVISWLSKCGSPAYNAKVTAVKYGWLAKHLPSVNFDEIHVVKYGTPKSLYAKSAEDVLFDDEERNRIEWTGKAYNVNNICEILKKI